jgi:hypothetical protein
MTLPPILLVHAAFSSGTDFAAWVRFFEAEKFHVVAPARGHWLIAPYATGEVAGRVLEWPGRTMRAS